MSSRKKGTITKDSVSLLPCFYFVELPILVSSMVSLYFLEWTDVFKPVKTGFICHDRSLSLPYIDPSHEVIPLLMLLSLAFAGPAITIMIGEGILFCCLSRRRSRAGKEANINAAGCNFNSFVRRAVRFVGVHAFGLCATALITDVLQLMMGHPAPYFLTVCKPNYTALSVTCEHNSYVLDDICSGSDPVAINQGRKSFPSQHATLASFAAVYVSMYFNSTLTDSSKLLKPLLVFSFVICAVICGLTRIIQYKNHAIDVYLGFLIGGAIAVYLGLYAVANFHPSEQAAQGRPAHLPQPPCSFISQEAGLHHLPQPGLPQDGLKTPGVNGEGAAALMTFSHTLPRVHTPQAIAAYEEAARRHAATLHHASMDSSRSKQLLSQWKSKNDGRKCSLQSPDSSSSSAVDQLPLHHHGSMELRPGPEPEPMALGLNGAFDPHAYVAKMAVGASATLPSNCSGITGGARMAMQPRPGSSQLVHIPEEAHENYSGCSPKAMAAMAAAANSAVQANWQQAAEKSVFCQSDDGRQSGRTPRIVQVMGMPKQQGLLQGLLQTHSKSLDEGTVGRSQGSGRHRGLAEPEPSSITEPSSLGSTTGSISGSTGAIVRVEAHPETSRPVIQAPSVDGTGSWRWRSLDHGGGGGGLRQSFELNDLNRDSESSESTREGSIDRMRSDHVMCNATTTASPPPIVTIHTQNTSQGEQREPPQGLSTIRVTPGDSSGSGFGGGDGKAKSETPSLASCRDATLRRKGNIILIPERSNSPDNTRNIFYKGTSITHNK